MYVNLKDCENENINKVIIIMRIIILIVMVITGEE